jgi:exodeoxyribonuclease III
MRIVSLNCNGLRSAAKKGFFDWLAHSGADVVCLQETKAQPEDLQDALFHPAGWARRFHSARKKGYAGVAIYSRLPPDDWIDACGAAEFDDEGRYLEARIGNLSVVSLYLPSGSAGPERQASKDRFLAYFPAHLKALLASGRDVVICADWNIAHTAKDLKNAKGNTKNSGFLPHERQWMTEVLASGWVDAARHLHADLEGELYTWWSNRGDAYHKNVGWRIDYQLVSPTLAGRISHTEVYKQQRFSDHAPLIVDYRP